VKKIILLVILISAPFLLTSCSYGIFNFASETGDLELELQLGGDNSPGVDSVIYELTPPDGSGVVFFTASLADSSYSHQRVDRMLTGEWGVLIKLMVGDTLFQSYSDYVQISSSVETRMNVNASYNGSSFDITCNSFINEDGTSGTPAFTISDTYLNPNYYINYRTDELIASVDFHITGSGFTDYVRNMELLYPDGTEIIFGEDNFSRAVFYSHTVEDALINIIRPLQSFTDVIDGAYVLKMTDNNNNGVRQELSDHYGDIESKIPKILGHDGNANVPEIIMNSVGHTFQWELSDNSRTGTVLLFVVDVNDKTNIYPTTDPLLVQAGTFGELFLGPAAISDGSYELVIAAIEEPFTTPTADAVTVGVFADLDLRTSTFPESIRLIYGSDTGLITYSSVSFNYSP
jgi:hypothetical protein